MGGAPVSLSLGDPLQLRAVADKPFYAELQTSFNPVQTLGAGVCQEFLGLIFKAASRIAKFNGYCHAFKTKYRYNC